MFEFNELIIWLEKNPEWIALGIVGASFIESFALIVESFAIIRSVS